MSETNTDPVIPDPGGAPRPAVPDPRPRTVPGEDFSFDIPDFLPPGGRFVIIPGGGNDE
jgi:hypothetical protein